MILLPPAAQPDARFDPTRNWDEDAGHENGNYQCACGQCGKWFKGHKRRMICKVCAGDITQPDARAVGIYPHWVDYAGPNPLLELEHINGDGSVTKMLMTRRDAEVVREFLNSSRVREESNVPDQKSEMVDILADRLEKSEADNLTMRNLGTQYESRVRQLEKELDAIRNTLWYARAKKAESALRDAPHAYSCLKLRVAGEECDCWKKGLDA